MNNATEDILERAAAIVPRRVEIDRALDDIWAGLPLRAEHDAAGAQLRTNTRLRRRRAVAAAAFVAVIAVAAPAAAHFVGLHTGNYGYDGSHYGEFLNLDSPEGLQLLRHYEMQYPLPPRGTWRAMEDRFARGPAGLGQAGVFEQAVGGEAQCQWTQEWLDAEERGTVTDAERAATVLREIPRWHVVTAYEDATHGGERLAQRIADAAARGNRAPAEQFVAANCEPTGPTA